MNAMQFLDDYPDSRKTVGNCDPGMINEHTDVYEKSTDYSNSSNREPLIVYESQISENSTDCSNSPNAIMDATFEPYIVYEPQLVDENSKPSNDKAARSYVAQNKNRKSKKQADAEVTSVFKDVLKECAKTIQEIACAPEQEKIRDSTSLLFESLAKTISSANLSQNNVRNIERKVVALVYEELGKTSVQ
ncbi:uncharacterized protein [Eurosta solidaginis]|uniref:uncharacterized protein n=1 Tax=Eurosta solidaginis TaxID=178769 RepID=UPI003530A0D6